MKLNTKKIDPLKEKNGAWVDYDGETWFLIGKGGNPAAQAKLTRLCQKWRRANRNREIPPEQMTAMVLESQVGTVLLGWKDLTDNGEPFTFTPENALRLLKDEPEVRAFIDTEAMKEENFYLDEAREAAEGAGRFPTVADEQSQSGVDAGGSRSEGDTVRPPE